MTQADVDPAADLILRGEWGDRREFFRWAVTHVGCSPLVAEVDGDIAGTGVGTANGPVGWVGTIFVDQRRRGGGLGAGLTRAVIEALDAAGCESLVLVATPAGRPVYEREGFSLQTNYHVLSAPGTDGLDAADAPAPRPFRPSDLAAMSVLDRAATGEDRAAILGRFASPETAHVVAGSDGEPRAFVVRAPWGGAALVAPDPDDALRLLAWRRSRAAADHRIRAGLPAGNDQGRRMLLERGWTEDYLPIRMVRGTAPAWQPDWLWGQFNFAMG